MVGRVGRQQGGRHKSKHVAGVQLSLRWVFELSTPAYEEWVPVSWVAIGS